MKLGEILKGWREDRGLTLKEAASRMGVSLPTLSRIEHGEQMDGETLAKLLVWVLQEKGSSNGK